MRFLFSILLALLALLGPALPASAASPRAVVILDASSSMWLQSGGKTRIEVAREALGKVLADVPDTLPLGFVAYGHRNKGDCGDIELLVPAEAGTADRIIGAAMSLNPRGKTPLSAAVQEAAEEISYTTDRASVVLITDGVETCAADPCAVAAELEGAAADLAVSVVGFGLTDAEGASVQCLAEITGGKFLNVADGDTLADAIGIALGDIPPPPPEPDYTLPPEDDYDQPADPVTEITFAPTAVLAEGGASLGEDGSSLVWDFSTANPDGTVGDWVRSEYGPTVEAAVEPGEYIVTARLDYVKVSQPVTIKADTVARPVFVLDAGRLRVRVIPYAGAEPDTNAAVDIEFSNGETTTAYGGADLLVPAGSTELTARIGGAAVSQTVEVVAGETVTKDIVVGIGRASVRTFYVEDMPVEDGNLQTEIVGARRDMSGERPSFGSSYGLDAVFDLLPGDYVAISTFDSVAAEQPFTVVAGELAEVSVILDAGVLYVDAPGAMTIEILGRKDIQGNRPSLASTYDVALNRTLPAGEYLVVVTYDGDAPPEEATATVTAGERTELKVQ
jgi:Ca-activated chloride channel family protein